MRPPIQAPHGVNIQYEDRPFLHLRIASRPLEHLHDFRLVLSPEKQVRLPRYPCYSDKLGDSFLRIQHYDPGQPFRQPVLYPHADEDHPGDSYAFGLRALRDLHYERESLLELPLRRPLHGGRRLLYFQVKKPVKLLGFYFFYSENMHVCIYAILTDYPDKIRKSSN